MEGKWETESNRKIQRLKKSKGNKKEFIPLLNNANPKPGQIRTGKKQKLQEREVKEEKTIRRNNIAPQKWTYIDFHHIYRSALLFQMNNYLSMNVSAKPFFPALPVLPIL